MEVIRGNARRNGRIADARRSAPRPEIPRCRVDGDPATGCARFASSGNFPLLGYSGFVRNAARVAVVPDGRRFPREITDNTE